MPANERPPLTPLALIAGMSGNLMEWYDFALYGVLASTLGQLFFPQGSRLLALLSVFGVFAAGYLMRVVGGAAFGHVAGVAGAARASGRDRARRPARLGTEHLLPCRPCSSARSSPPSTPETGDRPLR